MHSGKRIIRFFRTYIEITTTTTSMRKRKIERLTNRLFLYDQVTREREKKKKRERERKREEKYIHLKQKEEEEEEVVQVS